LVRYLEKHNIEDIAIGSAVLGTGGGGDPYLGKLATIREIERAGPLKMVTVDDLPDDALAVTGFGIGSPVPFLERITLTDELVVAYNAMTQFLGKKIDAIISAEIGGMNSVIPFALAARLGLPVIDADFMGRAYPEIQLVTVTLYGHSASPMAVADQHGNYAIFQTINNEWTERLARPAAIEMGAIAAGCAFPITVGDIRIAAVLGTVTKAEGIGAAIREANHKHIDPIKAVTDITGGFRLFTGRIVDVQRRIERGWAMGETRIVGSGDDAGHEMVVRFQNEHLVAILDGEIVVSVPDLIAILDSERGEPITTENLRYGFRVAVIGIPCDEKWRTPAGIDLGGPRHFKYDIDFVPVEERFGAKA
jgi:DUF917 family protein